MTVYFRGTCIANLDADTYEKFCFYGMEMFMCGCAQSYIFTMTAEGHSVSVPSIIIQADHVHLS